MASLLKHLEHMPEYRCSRKKKHDLAEMIACLIAAYSCGRTSVGRALAWCRNHSGLLRRYMKLEGGIASEATISRMLSGMDEQMFALVLAEWVAEILYEHGIHIIIDGKALCGATEKIKGGKVPYVLNAIESATQLVIAQLAIPDKTNEITAIPQLLQQLNIRGNTFTIDAIGTNSNIMEIILDNGGHLALQVKKNNPALYEEIVSAFDTFEQQINLPEEKKKKRLIPYMKEYDVAFSREKNRERIEYRKMQVCQNSDFLSKSSISTYKDLLPLLGTIGCSTQVRVPIEKDAEGNDITVNKTVFLEKGSHRKARPVQGDGIGDDYQRVGMISDMKLTAQDMAKLKRDHWKIEAGLHHVLDDVFREDRSTATRSKFNLSVIRKFAYNILRLAILNGHPDKSPTLMMDFFCDNPEALSCYLFCEMESLY